MQAYSLDLRTRIVEAVVDHQVGSQGAVAALFGVSRTLVKKLLRQRRETSSVAPKPHGGGQPPKLNAEQQAVVRRYLLHMQNDATLEELQTYVRRTLKVSLSRATMGRVIQQLALSRKKTLIAAERNEEQRRASRRCVARFVHQRLIFNENRCRT